MWDTALPSFLIGLREGLEAGLIVSILVATLVRADQRSRLPQVWTGVLAAVALAMSFGAVLSFTAANLSQEAQEAFGGALSVIAVGFVTAMVFWMRRSARSLSSEIREKVTAALAMGSGVLITTSFLAVGREGLETALFLWTNARAAGQAAGPLVGAAIGLLLAAGLCWGLYRRVLKINLTRFFTYTGAVLIVIAAGVLAYGLRDLQEGGVLPGNGALAVRLGDSRDAGSWYGTLLQGVLNLSPQMTWLQVLAYAGYLAVVMTLFVRGVRGTAPAAAAKAGTGGAGAAHAGAARAGTAQGDAREGADRQVTAHQAAGPGAARDAIGREAVVRDAGKEDPAAGREGAGRAEPAAGAGTDSRDAVLSTLAGRAQALAAQAAELAREAAALAAGRPAAVPEPVPAPAPDTAAGPVSEARAAAPARLTVPLGKAGEESAGTGPAPATGRADGSPPSSAHVPAAGAPDGPVDGPAHVPAAGATDGPTHGPTDVPAHGAAAGGPAADAVGAGAGGPAAAEAAGGGAARARSRRWLVPVAVVAVPAVIAGTAIAFSGGRSGGQAIAVSPTECGKGFTPPAPGRRTFQMRNTGTQTSEVYLIDPTTDAVYGEIEGLAPGTTRALVATIGSGTYAWRCVPTGGRTVTSAAVRVTGGGSVAAVLPVSARDLAGPLAAYKAYVGQGLATLAGQVESLRQDVAAGNLTAARADWLTAHLTYSSLGAAYGTFADYDKKINGRADGLPGGVHDRGFTGFHRIEYGLWHGESAASLAGPADELVSDVTGLQQAFPHQDFNASDLPLRTHEILENTLQFELTADTDEGSGTNLATAQANLAGTEELLKVLRSLIARRSPHLLGAVDADARRLSTLLAAQHTSAGWTPVQQLPAGARERIDGATGQLLEDLAPIPDLLEIRKSA